MGNFLVKKPLYFLVQVTFGIIPLIEVINYLWANVISEALFRFSFKNDCHVAVVTKKETGAGFPLTPP